jgi:hypothetical protein
MKLTKALTIIFLIFSFHNIVKADDIKDFEIEGMSVGDSLLDFFDKNEIEKNFVYKSDKYYLFVSSKFNSENYDGVQFHIKKNDKKYLIAAIEGLKLFDDNFDDCLKLKDLIVNDLKNSLEDTEIFEDEGNHDYDPTGNSKFYRTNFSINPKSKYINMSVTCYDWSKKIEDEYADKLSVAIADDEFNDFTNNEAY